MFYCIAFNSSGSAQVPAGWYRLACPRCSGPTKVGLARRGLLSLCPRNSFGRMARRCLAPP